MGNLDEAREYIARVVPFREDNSSWINVHWSLKGTDTKGNFKKYWAGIACHDVTGATNAVNYALSLKDTLDVYLCMSSQAKAELVTAKNGRQWHRARRLAVDAVELKSLYIDLDYKGGDKSYNSKEEMLAAFQDFLTKTGLPQPNVQVDTGGGVHVYWVMDRALPPQEWQPLAFALTGAIRETGLLCDSGCTIDSARILRIPDTFNRKTVPERPVKFFSPRIETNYSVDRIKDILRPWANFVPASVKPAAGNVFEVDHKLFPIKAPVADKLGAGIHPVEYPPVDLVRIIPECPFIREAVTTGGKTYTNPLWNLTTLMATFTDGGEKDAHLMARSHPDYSRETTKDLYNRKVQEKETKGLGWPHCSTIAATGAGPCKTCPHLTQGKTPFHYQSQTAPGTKPQNAPQPGQGASTVAGPMPALVPGVPLLAPGADLPKGYTRDAQGLVYLEWVDDDGVTKSRAICDYPLTQPWLQENPHGLHFSTYTHKDAQIFILTRDVGSTEMRKILQDQLMMLHNDEPKLVGEFLVSWIQKLKTTKNAVVSTTPFGWNIKGGQIEGFVYGGHLWGPTGVRIAPSPDPEIASQYTPTGTMDPWLRAAKMVTDQNRPDLNAIIAASFAAPLVKFTGHDGFLLSLWSARSGIGKTTAMKIGQAVWGDPVRALQGLDDTQNAVFNKIGELRSLPLFWDELKTEDDTRRFVNGVFKMTSGKEKSRMSSSVKQRKVGTWQTLLISASNESIIDFVASRTRMTTAGIMRVFEAEVKPGTSGQISVGVAQQMIAELTDNYGLVGLEYSKYLGSNFQTIKDEVVKEGEKLEAETQVEADERFWCSLMAALVVGARLANILGFTQIDEAGLRGWMIETLGQMRTSKRESANDMSKTHNVSDLLGQFLSAMGPRHTLKTNKIWVSAGKPAKGAIKPVDPNVQFKDSIYVQIGVEDKLIRLSSAAVSTWCKENQFSRHQFTKALSDKFGMKVVNGHLGSGTQFGQPMGYIIEIDGGPHPELEYLFD